MKHLKIVVGFGALFMLSSVTVSYAQNISTDPTIHQALAREYWEPGGQHFGFGSVRGTVDPSSRTGQVAVNRVSAVQVGSFSLQAATISGSYEYTAKFNGHPHQEHAPFDGVTRNSSSYRDPRADGTQLSYSIEWKGTQTHPANAYDGAQGGGYPAPTGARDEYKFDISGIATGIYLVSSIDLQSTERPGVWERTEDFGKATASEYFEGGKQGASGIYEVGAGLFSGNFERSLDGGLATATGIARMLFSGVTGFISGYAGPELSKTDDLWVTGFFNPASIDSQYAVLTGLVLIDGWISASSDWATQNTPIRMLGKAVDLASSVTPAKSVGKSVFLKDSTPDESGFDVKSSLRESVNNEGVHPSTPTGQRGNPLHVKPGTNKATSIGGRDYSGHALDRMQERGIPPSAVDDAIKNGEPSSGKGPGTTVYSGANGVTVVTGGGGRVVTVFPHE